MMMTHKARAFARRKRDIAYLLRDLKDAQRIARKADEKAAYWYHNYEVLLEQYKTIARAYQEKLDGR